MAGGPVESVVLGLIKWFTIITFLGGKINERDETDPGETTGAPPPRGRRPLARQLVRRGGGGGGRGGASAGIYWDIDWAGDRAPATRGDPSYARRRGRPETPDRGPGPALGGGESPLIKYLSPPPPRPPRTYHPRRP